MSHVKSISLSTRERRLLTYIHEYKERYPYSPDVREMSEAVMTEDEKPVSTSVLNYYLDRLERDGLISFKYLATKGKKHHHRAARTVHLTEQGKVYINGLLKRTLEQTHRSSQAVSLYV
jgi:DNA-binding PadR family transcriptional regulator